MTQKIAVVTATRAEYGLLSRLISLLEQQPDFDCQLLVTGAHLSPEHGMTVNEIKANGLCIAAEIPILQNGQTDDDLDIAVATSRALEGFAKVFNRLQPEAVIVLGDRYELLGICSAALLLHIPIVHLHGGEITEGAMDEAIRHAVTKMAALHFVAAEPYRQRVIQMGESPQRVFNVGSPGLDNIQKTTLFDKVKLESDLNFSMKGPLFLITYHPVTWGDQKGIDAVEQLFSALETFPQASIIWTAPNADAGGHSLYRLIEEWAKKTRLRVKLVNSLGLQKYLSVMKLADVVIGNSSSGIIEAPAMGTATVNIGSRQSGRLKAQSIIDCEESESAIEEAIQKTLRPEFQALCQTRPSLYGKGDTANAIVEILLATNFHSLNKKPFYDIS